MAPNNFTYMETFGHWMPLAFNDGNGNNDVANDERGSAAAAVDDDGDNEDGMQ